MYKTLLVCHYRSHSTTQMHTSFLYVSSNTEHVERVTRHGLVHNMITHVPPDYKRIPSRKEENEKKTIHVQSVVFVVRNC